MPATYDQLEITSAAELRAWLETNAATVRGVWLVTWKKKAAPHRHVAYDEVVREVLCFGWIDSQARPLDDSRSQLLLTPRNPSSGWSGANKTRIAELTAEGLMRPAGLAMVELAQRTGTWTALDDSEAGIEPEELRTALDANPDARRHWDGFPRSARSAILQWIGTAKRPQTREQRIRQTVSLAAENVRANAWPRP